MAGSATRSSSTSGCLRKLHRLDKRPWHLGTTNSQEAKEFGLSLTSLPSLPTLAELTPSASGPLFLRWLHTSAHRAVLEAPGIVPGFSRIGGTRLCRPGPSHVSSSTRALDSFAMRRSEERRVGKEG